MVIKRGAYANNTWGKGKELSPFSCVSETRISAAVISGAQAEDLEDILATLTPGMTAQKYVWLVAE